MGGVEENRPDKNGQTKQGGKKQWHCVRAAQKAKRTAQRENVLHAAYIKVQALPKKIYLISSLISKPTPDIKQEHSLLATGSQNPPQASIPNHQRNDVCRDKPKTFRVRSYQRLQGGKRVPVRRHQRRCLPPQYTRSRLHLRNPHPISLPALLYRTGGIHLRHVPGRNRRSPTANRVCSQADEDYTGYGRTNAQGPGDRPGPL